MARTPGCDGCELNLGQLSDLAQTLQDGVDRQDWHAVREVIRRLRTFPLEPDRKGGTESRPRGPSTWTFPHGMLGEATLPGPSDR